MNLSQKCQYAVRAILELSKRYGQGAVPSCEISESQAIPKRFLEVILNELKPTGLLDSRRGIQGGYFLNCDPAEITVGKVIRIIEGPLDPVRCTGDKHSACCPLRGNCSLILLWNRARIAVENVYDSTTFLDLIEQDKKLKDGHIPNYSI